MSINRPQTKYVIRKPATNSYFSHIDDDGNIVWTRYDNASRIVDRRLAETFNEYVNGILITLNPHTINHDKSIII